MKTKVAELLNLTVFPFAENFKIISEGELLALAQDIEKNGLIHPLVIWEEQLLDGRNRLRALVKTTITEVETVEFNGSEFEAVVFVNSVNLKRRHMTTEDLAFLALDLLPYLEKEAKRRQQEAGTANLAAFNNGASSSDSDELVKKSNAPQAIEIAASMVGVGKNSVQHAKNLTLRAPDLVEDIKAGRKKLSPAAQELKERETDVAAKIELIGCFPEAREKYYSRELDVHQSYHLANQLEAEQKNARKKKFSETIVHLEELDEIAERRIKDINGTIERDIKTEEQVDQMLALLEKLVSRFDSIERVLLIRRELIAEELNDGKDET